MCNAIRHRGPDDEGLWVDEEAGLALGHRRLAILDLSPNGRQPMISQSGRWVVIFNGEVYNFLEIRREIDAEIGGRKWRGHSDTEVILEAIELWGVRRAVPRFNGMFAMALWDRVARRLSLVRDRFGVKPIYAAVGSEGTVLFGSELSALAAVPEFPARLDRGILPSFLAYGYVTRPATIYEDCIQLAPGSVLELESSGLDLGFVRQAKEFHAGPFDANGKGWRYWSYWSLAEAGRIGRTRPFSGSLSDAVDSCEQLLRDSIRLRLLSDVPLGAFLSGGVDSSLVAALMTKAAVGTVRTFSIGFEDDSFDESSYALAVAQCLGTEHTAYRVTEQDSLEIAKKLPALLAEPLGDSSFIPTFLVSQLARKEVTVALTGDGGDELFGGYWKYREFRKLRSAYLLPPALRSCVDALARRIEVEPVGRGGPRWLRYRAVRGVRMATHSTFLDAYRYATTLPYDCRKLILHGQGITTLRGENLPNADIDLFETMLQLDSATHLPDALLVKVDRASMAVSLECREPLLDYRLAEFARSLPVNFHIERHAGKRILREVLYRYVPRKLIDRPKLGFAVPLARWLRQDLKSWAADILLGQNARLDELFEAAMIERLWNEHQSGLFDHKRVLWNLIVLRSWLADHRWA